MPLSPGERIDLKRRVVDALADEEWRYINLTLREFGFPTTDPAGQKEDYVLTTMDGAKDELLRAVDRHLHPALYSDEEPPPMATLLEGQENTLFNVQEQAEIIKWIADYKTEAQEAQEMSGEQMPVLEAKLDFIADAVAHTRRLDWVSLAVGAVASSIVGGVLTPDVVDKALNAMATGLGPLFGHPMPLLGP